MAFFMGERQLVIALRAARHAALEAKGIIQHGEREVGAGSV